MHQTKQKVWISLGQADTSTGVEEQRQ